MKTCPNCGTTLEDSVKFCKKCGASCDAPSSGGMGGSNEFSGGSGSNNSFGSGSSNSFGSGSNNSFGSQSYGMPQQNYGGQYGMNQNTSKGYPMSVGGWIGRSLGLGVLACVPVIGFIAYIVILVMWSKDMSKEETFRNWAKAQIVVIIVVAVISILIGVIIAASGYALLD